MNQFFRKIRMDVGRNSLGLVKMRRTGNMIGNLTKLSQDLQCGLCMRADQKRSIKITFINIILPQKTWSSKPMICEKAKKK